MTDLLGKYNFLEDWKINIENNGLGEAENSPIRRRWMSWGDCYRLDIYVLSSLLCSGEFLTKACPSRANSSPRTLTKDQWYTNRIEIGDRHIRGEGPTDRKSETN